MNSNQVAAANTANLNIAHRQEPRLSALDKLYMIRYFYFAFAIYAQRTPIERVNEDGARFMYKKTVYYMDNSQLLLVFDRVRLSYPAIAIPETPLSILNYVGLPVGI